MVLYPLLAGPVVNAHNVVLFSLGIFCGAYFWWLIVNVFCGISRSYITSNLMRRINQYSALGIICLLVSQCFMRFMKLFSRTQSYDKKTLSLYHQVVLSFTAGVLLGAVVIGFRDIPFTLEPQQLYACFTPTQNACHTLYIT